MANLRKVIGAHQPDEMLPRVKGLKGRDRIGGVARLKPRLEVEHADLRMMRKGFGCGQTGRQRRHSGNGLQRILRRDQPPYFVEAEPLQGFEADMAMAFMRRVERAAQ